METSITEGSCLEWTDAKETWAVLMDIMYNHTFSAQDDSQ